MECWQVLQFYLFYLVEGEVHRLDQRCLPQIDRGELVCWQAQLFQEWEVGKIDLGEEVGRCDQLLQFWQFFQGESGDFVFVEVELFEVGEVVENCMREFVSLKHNKLQIRHVSILYTFQAVIMQKDLLDCPWHFDVLVGSNLGVHESHLFQFRHLLQRDLGDWIAIEDNELQIIHI